MGMSASQARLLTITARLTQNELQSQLLTNSKVRLASETKKVSDDYMKAMDATKLTFNHFDDVGEMQQYDLTPAFIYSYTPLKNQYSIQNANGVNLVSATEAANYEKTDSLYEFLRCYDLVEGVKKTITVDEENPDWVRWKGDHEKWLADEPNPDDYTKTITTEETRRINSSPIYPALTTTIATCFRLANNGRNCFMHVMAALIGVGEHTTSSGVTYNVKYVEDHCDEHGEAWCWNTYDTSEEIGNTLRQSLFTDPCSEEEYDGEITTDYGTVYCKGDGSDSQRYTNVYDKIVDLLWDLHEEYQVGDSSGGWATSESLSKFFYLIEFDLGDSTTEVIEHTTEEFDQEGYDEAYEKWQSDEEVEPPQTIPVTKEIGDIAINDKDKGQWYTNLWYMMNGSETANLVKVDPDYVADKPMFKVLSVEKNLETANYQALTDATSKDASWLQDGLSRGTIQMKRTLYQDPSKDKDRVHELQADGISWTEMCYRNSEDIYSVQDEAKITEAQAKYEKESKKIKTKDKEYDTQLRNLDTIHNALQTEYESIKNVIGKNVERSFKTFS